MTAADAWYSADRASFLVADDEGIVRQLSDTATRRGWHVEPDQHQEWGSSVRVLKGRELEARREVVELVRTALQAPELGDFTDIVLEYDFRRRGLRIDCVLLAPGVVVVVEFKRTKLTAADRDQVAHYCISLVEFHERTRQLCDEHGVIVVPVLALTEGTARASGSGRRTFHNSPWGAVLRHPIECDRVGITGALRECLELRRSRVPVAVEPWMTSRFSPSSTILDAAISLFGQHDVSAIDTHAAPAEEIAACAKDVSEHVRAARSCGRNRIIFVSGSPGAGKTLVGLRLAFSPEFREDAVFVTGNAPLVDVLTQALRNSYVGRARSGAALIASGYVMEDAHHVIRNATFKIVKAHRFLGERGKRTEASDGNVVIFDEAQRTYEKGRQVAGHQLEDHEADLILASLEASYDPGAVVVALVGHNQAINTGERGAVAWFEAAIRRDWDVSVGDMTLSQCGAETRDMWASHTLRKRLAGGHLAHSMRFYRNKGLEEWAHAVLEDDSVGAVFLAGELVAEGHTIWMTRDLATAKQWAREQRVGEERIGLIASGQARRLAAEGLFVGLKPPIAHWMLAPSGDIRSSNMLEIVQNTYQVQGLELDYTVVCWDADLRRSKGVWSAHKISGANWQRDKRLDVAKNGYRVLLTRARKGMLIFVPRGDPTGEDATRCPAYYDGIADFLTACGVESVGAGGTPNCA